MESNEKIGALRVPGPHNRDKFDWMLNMLNFELTQVNECEDTHEYYVIGKSPYFIGDSISSYNFSWTETGIWDPPLGQRPICSSSYVEPEYKGFHLSFELIYPNGERVNL